MYILRIQKQENNKSATRNYFRARRIPMSNSDRQNNFNIINMIAFLIIIMKYLIYLFATHSARSLCHYRETSGMSVTRAGFSRARSPRNFRPRSRTPVRRTIPRGIVDRKFSMTLTGARKESISMSSIFPRVMTNDSCELMWILNPMQYWSFENKNWFYK